MSPTESENDLASLRDVFEILSDDLNICFEPLQQCLQNPDEDGNYRFVGAAARTYVNVAFACIASVCTCMRQCAVARLQCDASSEEIEELAEQLTDGPAMTPLEKAVRLAFGLLDRTITVESQWQANEQWWLNLLGAIEIKYRLASPASSADLEISAGELMMVVDAEAGFRLRVAAYLE
jgi:hypothetical protein